MILYLVLLAALCCWGVKFSCFHPNYLEKDQTDAFKGIFALLILFSHIRAHITLDGRLDFLYNQVFILLGQITVVPFFFYSGYGVIQGIRRKEGYVKTFFKNRILKFLIGYNIVSITLGIIWYCIGKTYPLENYLLAWCGWKTVGGTISDGGGLWYIFVLLVLYLITYAVLQILGRLWQKNEKRYLLMTGITVFVLSTGLMAVLAFVKTPSKNYWYNTLMAYPFGMLYAVCKDRLDFVMRKNWVWLCAIGVILVAVAGIFVLGLKDAVSYSVMGFLFMTFICLFTMRVRMVNPVLKWIGGLSFGIYILQRPIMMLFEYFGLAKYNILYTAVCIAATLVVSLAHQWISGKLNGIIFRKKKTLALQ